MKITVCDILTCERCQLAIESGKDFWTGEVTYKCSPYPNKHTNKVGCNHFKCCNVGSRGWLCDNCFQNI